MFLSELTFGDQAYLACMSGTELWPTRRTLHLRGLVAWPCSSERATSLVAERAVAVRLHDRVWCTFGWRIRASPRRRRSCQRRRCLAMAKVLSTRAWRAAGTSPARAKWVSRSRTGQACCSKQWSCDSI